MSVQSTAAAEILSFTASWKKTQCTQGYEFALA